MARRKELESNSKALLLIPDLEYNDEQHRVLIKALTNLFEFYANSGSTVKDRKNMRTIKTGRPNKFLLQKINKG